MPTIKIVDFTSGLSCAILSSKMVKDWNRIYCVVTSVCVFRYVYTLRLTSNLEVKKMSSDSESNSSANSARISDKDIKEKDQEDVEESLTH